MRIAVLYGAAIASRALAGVLSYGMQKLKDIHGLKSWQWMFLLEGSPTIPLSIITYLFLDNVPNAVQWLNNIEKQLLTNLLQNDAGVAGRNSTPSTRHSWRQIYRDVDKPTYRRGHGICGGMIAASLILTIILRVCLMRENHRRTNLSPEEYEREAAVKEPCDWHPDVRYEL
ncbi:unnamed protein product [Rotaria sordida]|uniref:Uncharacterized protein n=1 Tax=Rotaria sordida TaxID=392033 RepID=A0A819BBF1_9BILA|nr:unnamed protein product [Rotaria sordida]